VVRSANQRFVRGANNDYGRDAINTVPHFDVLGFGAVAVDDLLYVDAYPPAESKARVRRRLRQCGGLTGTALVAAARLGSRCAYVGALGNDDLSQFVIETFGREGIDSTYCTRRDDARPAHSTIVVDGGRGTRTIFSSVDGLIGADPRLPDAALIRCAGAVLIDHHGFEGTLRAARIARASGVGVVADFERNPQRQVTALLPLVDHLIVSQRFARELTGREDPGRAAEQLRHDDAQAVIVTCGAAGCWYLGESEDRARHFPAFEVEAVDTTGCGDVFHGAYASALARAEDLRGRIALASAAAALKARQRGGQAGCPAAQAVEEFLEMHGGSTENPES